MQRALANESVLRGLSSKDEAHLARREADVDRASRLFALAHVFALLTGIGAAIFLQRSMSMEGAGTAAAVCIGLTVGLVVVARRQLLGTLTEQARRRGLSPEKAREEGRRRFARYFERRARAR